MVSLRIQADADLPLVQPGMDLMIDLDRQLPECVPFPECLIIHAQNIWCARWTVSNRSTPGISRFVSGVWIQLAVLNSPESVLTGYWVDIPSTGIQLDRSRTDGLDCMGNCDKLQRFLQDT